ncbi:MAG: YidC/Oxa1 family insertase periplasmic-domain containing protein [Planctomycetota bacterium]|nr:YidC/Oxa1 family insertase periplasmic-domain containing protein [Planctomycetota bacterium]
MDNKRMLGAMAAVLLLVMGYYIFVIKYLAPRHPEWDMTGAHNRPVATDTTTPSLNSSTNSGGMSNVATTRRPTTAPSGVTRVVGADASSTDQRIGSFEGEHPPYALGLEVSDMGAALDSVVINGAKAVNADPHAKDLYTFQKPYDQQESLRALETRTVVLDGQPLDVASVPWRLESHSQASLTYGIEIRSPSDVPLVHISKTYQVEPAPSTNRDNSTGGFELNVTHHIENLSNTPHAVHLVFDGPTMPPREIERSDDRQVIVGYDKGENVVDVVRYALTDFKPGSEFKDLTVSAKGNKILWAGLSSVYFGAVVQPLTSGQIAKVGVRALNASANPEDRQIVMDFDTADFNIAPNQSTDVPLAVFCGPKERKMLEGDYYSAFPRDYSQLLGSSSFCGICTVSWLVDRLVDLLTWFHWMLHDWGLAIILLVVIVRSILHPITKSSQVSMMRMQKMGPELQRLKDKYGDDKDAYAKAQMEIYKQMGVTPVLGCLPMFLQMPIWIALYSALQNEYRLRQEPFLWGWTWIHDLARPDRLIAWDSHSFTIPLLGLRIASLNVLPLLLGVVFFLQQKYTPKPPATTPEQQQQQKMMQWMSLLFPVFLYPAPSGLNLYILTSTAIGVIESKRIRDHIKQKQAEEASGKVIIDAKQTRQGKLVKKDAGKPEGKPGFVASLWANLQQRAEELRNEAERNKNKKK